MELQVTTLDGKAAGSVTLKDDIFGLEPRADILHRMVRYQQLKAMAGTHDVKNRSEALAPARSSSSRRVRAAPVTATARRRSSAAAAGPSVRPRAATRSSCPRRSAPWR